MTETATNLADQRCDSVLRFNFKTVQTGMRMIVQDPQGCGNGALDEGEFRV